MTTQTPDTTTAPGAGTAGSRDHNTNTKPQEGPMTNTTAQPTHDAKRAAYIEGLRQIADFLEAHPTVPLPYLDSIQTGGFEPTMDIYLLASDGDEKQVMADIARAMGRAEKHASHGRMRIFRRFAGIALVVSAARDAVCERVVTGTREVEVTEPDPVALAAVPTVTRTETVETAEWICPPLLAGTEVKTVAGVA